MEAGSEAYRLLQSLGYQIRPENDEKNLIGIRGFFMAAAMAAFFRTKMRELAVTNHCRNAVDEMQFLTDQFNELRKKNPSCLMPVFDSILNEMPSWNELRREYSR